MQKPISIVREETVAAIANIINSSGLPPMVVEPILRDFLQETRTAMRQQYEKDKKAYEEAVAAEQEDLDVEGV